MPSSIFPSLRNVALRLHFNLVTVLGAALLFSAGALSAKAQTTTFTCSGEGGSNCALQVGANQTTASTSSFTVPTAGTIQSITVELYGVWANGDTGYSMGAAEFLLTGPGGSFDLLGETGDTIDGDDNEDAGSGLHGLNIILEDGQPGAPMACGSLCSSGESNNWPPGNGSSVGNAGTITDTVKPGSYFGYEPSNGSQAPPLGVLGDWPDTDGCNPDPILTGYNGAINCLNSGAAPPTLTSKFGTTTANGTWTLTVENVSGVTSAISITNWSVTITYASLVSTSTSISSNANPSNASNTVTFTASVSATSGTPTGTVTFTSNSAAISGCTGKTLSGGQAACATTLSQGNNVIEASYTPGSGFGSSSSSMTELIEATPSQSGNKWCNSGQIVAPGNVAGIQYPSIINVTGYPNGSTVGGNLTVELLNATGPAGVNAFHLLVAPGGQNLDFFDSTFSFNQPSSPVNLTIFDSAGQTPSGGSPPSTGNYDPYDGNENGIANDGFAPSVAHSIDSSVPGIPGTINRAAPLAGTSDTNFQQAFSGASANGDWALYTYAGGGENETIQNGWCVTLDVNTGVATTTSVASNSNPQTTGASATLTATVQASGTPVTSGTVTFLDGGQTPAGTVGGNNVVTLNGSGQAAFTSSSLTEGDHSFTATYNGTSSFNGSFGTLVQRINDATTLYGNGATISHGPACGATYCYCNAGPISTTSSFKGAFTPNPSIIDVTNLPGTINNVGIGLNQYSSAATILYSLESMVVSPTGADLDYFSNAGWSSGGGTASLGNYIFSDSASGQISSSVSTLSPGTYKPTSFVEGDSANWPEPTQPYFSGYYTPPSAISYAGPRGGGTFGGQFANTNPEGNWALYMTEDDPAGAASAANGWCVNFTENPVTVAVGLSHQGDGTGTDFVQGESNAQITTVVTAGNSTGPTGDPLGTNPLKVVDALPTGLTYSSFSGTGWSCSFSSPNVNCTNDSAVAQGASYPTLTVDVNVSSSAPASISNSVSVSGAGITNNSGNDTITVDLTPVLSISKSHTGNFTAGSTGVWNLTVSNTATGSSTSGTVTVGDTLPSNYTLASYTSTSSLWTCGTIGSGSVTCTAIPGIAGGSSSTINLTVNVPSNSPTSVSNTALAWGGGDSVHTNSGNAATSNTDTVSVSAPPAITSGNSTTFIVGTAGSFTVTATGDPAPTFSESGALPSGVTMNSSGLLSGTPAAGSGGTYSFTITATNGISPDATQGFTLTVDQPPAVTSANNTTFMVGSASSFTVTTTAFPTAALSESGVLPNGVTFIDNGNGTATLAGTPAAGMGGAYPLTITASNGTSPNATQSFTLAVDQPPAITSANSATFGTGLAGSFTVTTNGYPAPALSESGSLPSGVTFTDNGNGTATLAGTPALGSAGSYPITILATNGLSPDASESFALTVDPPPSYVVTTNADDATGTPSDCPTPSSGNTCTLRDALAAAASAGSGIITFDGTAFSASNSTALNTITLANGTLNIPADTTITGPTSGSGYTLGNLVTVDGGGTVGVFATSSAAVTVSNLAIQNGNAAYGGGIFNNGGAMTVANNTFTNNTATQYGGAILSIGIATVTDSTFTGNTAEFGGGIINLEGTMTIANNTFTNNSAAVEGGGLYNNDQTTMSSSTLSGNSAGDDGGGIEWAGGLNNMANSIVSGNSAPSDPDASPFSDLGGNQVGVSGINLGPLYSYGGPTQTLIPLPGSVAICGGVASNIPFGVTTDQRGFPNQNTTYPGYSSTTPCVDSGAVQTNYTMAFSTQPPASGIADQPITPAPVISLSESGSPIAANSGTVTMTDGASLLGGTTAETFSSGAASFNNLTISQAINNDLLIATLSLNGTTNLKRNARTLITVTTIAATLTPASGTLSTSQAFSWSNGDGPTKFEVLLGTGGNGTSDIYDSGITPATSATITIPGGGVMVYGTLRQLVNGAWQVSRYTFMESGSPTPATLTPSSGTLATSQAFTWNNGVGASYYGLLLGTTGPGSSDIYNSQETTATSVTVPIPSNGVTVYGTLRQLINGTWQVTNYTFMEPGTTTPATLTPSSGTLASSQLFTWNNGAGPVQFTLLLGTTGVGSADLYNSQVTTATSATVTIPPNGLTVYGTLRQLYNGTWMVTRYTFMESGSPTPATLTPSSGTLLDSQLFTWNNGAGPVDFTLLLGTTGPGSTDIYNSEVVTATSATVSIPTNGVTVYGTLRQLINGTWMVTRYTFTEPTPPAP